MSDPVIIGAVCFLAGALAGAAVECYCLFDKTTELIVAENSRLKSQNYELAGQNRLLSAVLYPLEGSKDHVATSSEAALSGEYDGAGLS